MIMNRLAITMLPLALLAVFFNASCSREGESTKPKAVRVGVLPDESVEQLAERFAPLFEYLSKQTGVPYKLVIPESYAHLLEMFHNNEVDLAYFGAMTFLKAHLQDQAVPLVMRDVDVRFTSYFLIGADNPAQSIEDCSGMTFSFGSKLSTSGHLMPRHFMKAQGIVPETFYSDVRYSGAHDKTAIHVRDGVVDVGAANAHIVDNMFEKGTLTRKQVRVLWETPPYPDYVWAIQKAISPAFRTHIRDAFLQLTIDNPDHSPILKGLGSKFFLPAGIDDFTQLQNTAKELGLLKRNP